MPRASAVRVGKGIESPSSKPPIHPPTVSMLRRTCFERPPARALPMASVGPVVRVAPLSGSRAPQRQSGFLDPTKDKKDIAIEVTIALSHVALLFAFLGVPPPETLPWFLAPICRRRARVCRHLFLSHFAGQEGRRPQVCTATVGRRRSSSPKAFSATAATRSRTRRIEEALGVEDALALAQCVSSGRC